MKSYALAFVAALGLAVSVDPSLAQGTHSHSQGGHSHRGPHGGVMVDVTGGHAELVESGKELTLYLTDEAEKPLNSQGASGRATVLLGGKTETVDMMPVQPDKLVGALAGPLASGARVVVSVKLANGKSFQMRHSKR